jgi:hypothetical protein
LNDFKGFPFCLKIVQVHETGLKQGKIHAPEIFSAELSPDSVDSFALASAPASVQPLPRIDAAQ